MDLSCIISSGDIELYVLGLLPADEASKMEQLLEMFPELREEADRISLALESVANAGEMLPSANVKDNLMAAISTAPVTGSLSTQNQLRPVTAAPETPVHRMSRRPMAFAIAASLIALVSIAALVYLLNRNAVNQDALAKTQQQLDQARQREEQSAAIYNELLKLEADESYKQVQLKSVPGKPAGLATVYWNRRTNEVYIIDLSLPAAPAGKQYQLWALIDGKPADGGVLAGSRKTLQKMRGFDEADAFAITLENAGGSATPTLEQLYVLGNTSE